MQDNKDVFGRQRAVLLSNLFTLVFYQQVAARLQSH